MHNRAILNREKKRGDEGLKWVRDEDRLFFRMQMRNVKTCENRTFRLPQVKSEIEDELVLSWG